MKFGRLGLRPELVRAVIDAGYSTPTPVQERAIPLTLDGRDLIGCAQTGTGKTAAFLLPTLHRLAAGRPSRHPRGLIVTPTRELAAQVGGPQRMECIYDSGALSSSAAWGWNPRRAASAVDSTC